MKKFGRSNKGDEEDSNRAGLFGSRKKSSTPQNDNPYAQDTANDPYATPYQQARAGLPSGPRGGAGGRPGGLPSGPGPRGSAGGPPPPYSSQSSNSGYGNEKVGNSGGYGGNRYDDGGSGYGGNPYGSGRTPSVNSSTSGVGSNARAGARGPGGYGGMGGGGGDDDGNRDALFAGAKERYQAPERRFDTGGGYGQSGASGGSGDGSYGGYGERRELTEEEQAAEEQRDTSNQIRQVRDETLASGLRSLQMIEQSEETARGTLARLGAQHERLHNTEANLDRATIHNRVAEERTKELKTLNRSMFAVHVSNPFTSKQRAAQRDADIMDKHRRDRDIREATRKDAYATNQRMEDTFRGAEKASWRGTDDDEGAFAANASKFTFVDDDDEDGEKAAEDMRKEREIMETEKAMLRGAKKLNYLARAIGEEVESQNTLIDRITVKSDAVDDGVRMNREKLNRF